MINEEKYDDAEHSGEDEKKNENDASQSANTEQSSSENNFEEIKAEKIKKLFKSKSNRILFGVCGGLAEYLEIDPLIIRLLFVLSIIFSIWGVVIYMFCALLIPENPSLEVDYPEKKEIIKKENIKIIIGSALILLGIFILLKNTGLWDYHFFGIGRELFIPVVLITTGIFLLIKYNGFAIFTYKHAEGETQKFYRSATNKKIAGVCGGLGDYLGIDSTLVRIFWLLFTFGSFGLGILIYLIFVIFIPEKNSGIVNE